MSFRIGIPLTFGIPDRSETIPGYKTVYRRNEFAFCIGKDGRTWFFIDGGDHWKLAPRLDKFDPPRVDTREENWIILPKFWWETPEGIARMEKQNRREEFFSVCFAVIFAAVILYIIGIIT